jgi:hypothetical protein
MSLVCYVLRWGWQGPSPSKVVVSSSSSNSRINRHKIAQYNNTVGMHRLPISRQGATLHLHVCLITYAVRTVAHPGAEKLCQWQQPIAIRKPELALLKAVLQ